MNLKPNQELDALATQHMEITGAKEEQARYYLLKAKWDLMLAINLFLNEQEEKKRFEEKKAGGLPGSIQRKPTNSPIPVQLATVGVKVEHQPTQEGAGSRPEPDPVRQGTLGAQQPLQKSNAFEFLSRGVSEKGKLAHLYQKLETQYATPARSTLGGYVYREPDILAMRAVKLHPDRLLSFHEDASQQGECSLPLSDGIEAELDALVAEDQRSRTQQAANLMDFEQTTGSVVTKGLDIEFASVPEPSRTRDKVVAPTLKEAQSVMFRASNSNPSPKQRSLAFPRKLEKVGLAQVEAWEQSQSGFIKEAPLFLGQLPSIFRFRRTPRANMLKTGDIFKGERGKVSDTAAFGKGKLPKQDSRRFTIEIIEDGLILGQIEEKASKLLVPLIDASILTVWIRFASIPNFSSPISESEVSLELFLLPTALTKPVVGLPSKEEDVLLSKVGSIKYQLGKLMNNLSILPENREVFELVRDIATKPLSDWDWDGLIRTSFFTSRDSKEGANWSQPAIAMNPEQKIEQEPEALETIDPDNRLMRFLNRDLDSSDQIVSCEEPSSFAKDLKLMNHQKYALSWLRMREGIMPKGPEKLEQNGEGNLHPMWCQFNINLKTPQNQRFLENYEQESSASVQGVYKIYFNPYSGQLSHIVPSYSGDLKNFKGGILADEMGLGKTVMMIALLLSNRLLNQHVHVLPKSVLPTLRASGMDQIAEKDLSSLGQAKPFTKSMKATKNNLVFMSLGHLKHCIQHNIEPGLLLDTLIVVPTFLAYQWRDEIKKFSSEPVRVLVYSEEEKVQQDLDIRTYDVVIVSYGKLSYDYRNSKSQIHSVYWHRIIIDEAHQIRNRKTLTSKAICALAGDRRWALTGTPVQNSLEDLYTLVSFMNYTPWSEYQWWNQNINKGLADPDPVRKSRALDILSKILKPVTLRRTKAQHRHLLGLGERSETNLYIQLDQYEQEEYSKFFLKSKANRNNI